MAIASSVLAIIALAEYIGKRTKQFKATANSTSGNLKLLKRFRIFMLISGLCILIAYAVTPAQEINTQNMAAMFLFAIWIIVSTVERDWQ